MSRSHDHIIKDGLILFREIMRRERQNMNNSNCPLAFFKKIRKQFPSLAEIVDIFTYFYSATSCESQCLLSDVGELISLKITRLAESRAS